MYLLILNVDLYYRFGTNSYPTMYDSRGESRSKSSYYKWRANRTFIGVDNDGYFLMGNTQEGFFSLWRMGHFFQKYDKELNIEGEGYILNMDGGPPACISVNTTNYDYVWYGFQEGNNTHEIAWNKKNQFKWRIPTVVAAIKRNK